MIGARMDVRCSFCGEQNPERAKVCLSCGRPLADAPAGARAARRVAARLEQAAADGEVLVGADTFQLVRDEAILEPVEPLALKGKARPLPVWRLVDGARGDRRAAPRLQAPLVGRADELERLRTNFAE